MDMNDIRGEPIQLITVECQADGKEEFEINYEALDVLKAIDTPVSIVSMAGGARLGKSFLLNSVLGRVGQDKSGFDLNMVGQSRRTAKKGQNTDGTKGVWMWGEPIRKDEDNVHVIFLDF